MDGCVVFIQTSGPCLCTGAQQGRRYDSEFENKLDTASSKVENMSTMGGTNALGTVIYTVPVRNWANISTKLDSNDAYFAMVRSLARFKTFKRGSPLGTDNTL